VKKARTKALAASDRIPLCKPYISEQEERAVGEVLRSGWLMQGPKVAEFERLVADYVGTRFAVAVNSGTSALCLALRAVGLGEGDEVIMPSHSFVATANSAILEGGRPVFADIGRRTYNIDPPAIEKVAGSHARAIIVVHQIGFSADMDPIAQIAQRLELTVIEDAACSLGSTYRGRQTGSFGQAACLSFHPRKVITTGEGGMVLTDSEEIAETVGSLRNHGIEGAGTAGASGRSGCGRVGHNYRMTDIQAAIGIAQLGKLEEIIRLRTRLAERYGEAISQMPALELPTWPEGSVPNYQSFAVELADEPAGDGQNARDAVVAHMQERGIECARGIQPIHREPAYEGRYGDEHLPETIRAARCSFFLPLYPGLTDEEQDFVIGALGDALAAHAAAKEAG